MAVRGHDRIGIGSDFRRGDEFGIRLHRHVDTSGLRRGCQPVLRVMNDDPGDLDPVFAQHVEGRYAEMAGADEGDPHVFYPSLGHPSEL